MTNRAPHPSCKRAASRRSGVAGLAGACLGYARQMIGQLSRGAIAGAAATWVMDQVTTAMLSAQPREVTEQEREAQPNGQSSAANLVDQISGATGTTLSEPARGRAATAVHWALGVVPGALYAVARRRLPLVGAAGGLLYGLLLFAGNDEALNSALGLSGPPDAYPAASHARGLAGHLVLGAVTDSVLDALGG